MARLVDKQVFMPDGEGSKKKYMALLPEEFIDRQRQDFSRTLSVLERDLPALQNERAVSFIWNIGRYEDLIDKACRLIDEAKDTLLLSTWRAERETLEPFLVRAEARKVRIAAIHFGHNGGGAGAVFNHPIEDTIYQEKGGRGLVLVADARAALVGTIDNDGRVHGAFSANPGFITLAEDYIKHDIYIMKIIRRFDGLMVRTFGDNYTHLRNIFEDKDEP
jgi:sugar-specific transcriptional regulator TrmB